MSYKTIVTNLAVDANPAPIVKLATELAQRFDAHLVDRDQRRPLLGMAKIAA